MDIVKINEIQEDEMNANKHTQRGADLLRKSLEKFGFAEAGTLDKNNIVVGGNLRTKIAGEILQSEDAIIIDVDGDKPVFIRRKDIDITTQEGRELSLALNRVAQASIQFDPEIIDSLRESGTEIETWWDSEELLAMFEEEEIDLDFGEMTGFGIQANTMTPESTVEVTLEVTIKEEKAVRVMQWLDNQKGVTWQQIS